MYEGATQDPTRWDGSRPGMDNDEANGERKICIRQASSMESTAAEGTTHLSATATTAPDTLISKATMAEAQVSDLESRLAALEMVNQHPPPHMGYFPHKLHMARCQGYAPMDSLNYQRQAEYTPKRR